MIDPLGLFSPFGGPGFTNVMPNKPPSWSEQANNYPSPVPGLGEGVNMHNAIPGQFAILGPLPAVPAIDAVFDNPLADMINSIPPGESTGYPPADLSIDIFQIMSEFWERMLDDQNCKK